MLDLLAIMHGSVSSFVRCPRADILKVISSMNNGQTHQRVRGNVVGSSPPFNGQTTHRRVRGNAGSSPACFQWPDTAESPWQRVFVTKFHGCAPQVAHGNLRSVGPRRTFFAVRATQDAILMAPFGITIMVAKGLVIVMMNVNLIGF